MLLFHANCVNKKVLDEHDQFVSLYIYALITLIKKGYFGKSRIFYSVFKQYRKRLIKMKWNEMKCHWSMCNKTRKNLDIHESMQKCSKCKISRYCSKKCQKFDWKYGIHGQICSLYCIDPHQLQQERFEAYQLQQMRNLFKNLQATSLFA